MVKENQETLYREIEACLQRAAESESPEVKDSYYEKTDLGHGREEFRCYVVLEDPEGMSVREDWPQLNVVGMCFSERKEADGKPSYHTRYFIGSKRAKARYYGQALREHWKVENGLHWRLDVTFREDDSRLRQRQAAANLAVVRRRAQNLARQDKTERSVAQKRFAAALDTDYLEAILAVGDNLGTL